MRKKKIFVAGHNGMVGSALIKLLEKQNVEIIVIDRKKLDLLNQSDVRNFFRKKKIDQVYLAAAKVGGIYANSTFPGEFIYKNIMIQTNIIHSAFLAGIKKLLFLGSSCIYPKNTRQPIKEGQLLAGELEPTNEPYAIAKIAGIKLCESYNRQYNKEYQIDYRSVMPTNLYGEGDYYHPENSHVIPALIYRLHQAKKKNSPFVSVWGSGKPRREFLHVDDLASACFHVMNLDKVTHKKYTSPMCSHINVGSGTEYTIRDLVKIIKDIVGYKGQIIYDLSKPDGISRKLLDSSILRKLGWKPKINLKNGLIKTYNSFESTKVKSNYRV